MEKPVFFENRDHRLFGVLHSGHGTGSRNSGTEPCFVFCHPFAEEKLFAHRTLVNLARALTAAGAGPVLRFDFMGHGDSEGRFEDSTVQSRLSDIQRAVEYGLAETSRERVVLLGVRLGATLAAIQASRTEMVQGLVLISPVIDGRGYMNQCLRSNLTFQMIAHGEVRDDRQALSRRLMAGSPVNIDGYLLTGKVFDSVNGINLLDSPPPRVGEALIISVGGGPGAEPPQDLEKLHLRYGSIGIRTRLERSAVHQFWKESAKYDPGVADLASFILDWSLGIKP